MVLLRLILLWVPIAAWAHPGHSSSVTFAEGWLHPWLGWDHLISLLAVGMWTAALAGRAIWAVPLSFLAAMLSGALLAAGQVPVSGVEPSIAAAAIALGIMFALRWRPALRVATLVAAAIALFHGYAHVADLQSASHGAGYIGGFLLASAMIMGIGAAFMAALRRLGPHTEGLGTRGVGLALAGMGLSWLLY